MHCCCCCCCYYCKNESECLARGCSAGPGEPVAFVCFRPPFASTNKHACEARRGASRSACREQQLCRASGGRLRSVSQRRVRLRQEVFLHPRPFAAPLPPGTVESSTSRASWRAGLLPCCTALAPEAALGASVRPSYWELLGRIPTLHQAPNVCNSDAHRTLATRVGWGSTLL